MNLRDIKIVLKDSNYADILTAVERKRAQVPFSIALFHNLIFIDAGNECKSGFNKMYHSGGVYEAHGEDFSFEPFCLPVHSAGSIHLHDPYFGSALNHTRSSFLTSYALEAYNWKTLQVWFFVRISCQSHQ